jgi:ADP-ribose pyrophosphatase YjhB (NUDIX family)
MKAYKSEKEFLANYDVHDFDVPLVTVDMAILTVKADALCVLAVKRSEFPKQGRWALPGGFIDLARDRTIEEAARRKLAEKTGVDTAHMEQVITVGNKKRDPRGWSITVVYMALVAADQLSQASSASADEISWVPVDSVAEKCKLAFDHQDLLAHCVERLRTKSTYTWLPSNLMPELFTLTELQHTFEIVIGRKVDAKSFRRRILDAQLVEETGRSKLSGRRHAQLFRISSIGSEYVFSRTMEGSRS